MSCVCLVCSALAFAKTLHAKSVWREVAPVQFPMRLARVVARWQEDDEDEEEEPEEELEEPGAEEIRVWVLVGLPGSGLAR